MVEARAFLEAGQLRHGHHCHAMPLGLVARRRHLAAAG
jgi:hypothetical protein